MLLLTIVTEPAARQDDEASAARRVLQREFGLRQAAPSDIWLAPKEVRLRDRLAGLERAQASVAALERQVEQRIEANRVAWQVAQQQIAVLKAAAAPLNSGDKKRRELEQKIKQLQALATPPENLGAAPDVQRLVIQWTNERLSLTIDLLEIRQLIPAISKCYAALRENPRVQQALEMLGPTARLGPMQDDYGGQLRRLDAAERLVLTDWSPLYLQSGQQRVGAIIQERLPVTWTWQDSAEPTLLTSSVVQAAGLSERIEASEATVTVARGRRVRVRSVTIPKLRFGRHVLEAAPAFVLPPEAEDIGCRISREMFSAMQVKAEPERLRLVIAAAD